MRTNGAYTLANFIAFFTLPAGIGRIGGMAAPLVVGMMIEAGSDMHTVFYMFASVFIIIAVAVFALGVETKQKNLENI